MKRKTLLLGRWFSTVVLSLYSLFHADSSSSVTLVCGEKERKRERERTFRMSQVNKPAPCTQHAPHGQENQPHLAVAAFRSWFPDFLSPVALVRSVGGSIKSAMVAPAEAHGDRMPKAWSQLPIARPKAWSQLPIASASLLVSSRRRTSSLIERRCSAIVSLLQGAHVDGHGSQHVRPVALLM